MASLISEVDEIKALLLESVDASVRSDVERRLSIMEHLDGLCDSDRVRMAQKLTCWGSLSYCCSIRKGCPWLLAALKACDITPAAYTKVKESVNWYSVSKRPPVASQDAMAGMD
jgi:hypothetical protein